MASQIETLLNTIATAIYGRDMRSAIHDSIEICYTDVSTGQTMAETAAAAANSAAASANSEATAANTAAGLANDAADNAEEKASAAEDATTAAIEATEDAIEATENAIAATEDTEAAIADAVAAKNEATNAAQAARTNADLASSAATTASSMASSASSAADSARTAATSALNAAGNANGAYQRANTAISNANTATTRANNAADSATEAAGRANDEATAASNAAAGANTARVNAETATTAANGAAASARTAAEDASSAAADAVTATSNARTATTAANTATTRANNAADTIDLMTVDAEDAPYTTAANATVSNISGHKHIHFILRQGVPGPGFVIKGNAYATLADLQENVPNPEIGDMYNVGSAYPYYAYRWTGTQWENQGPIGNSITQITPNEVQTIQNGSTVPEDNTKALGIAGLTYYIQTIQSALFNAKVDKVTGKGLSTNDFTDAYKDAVDNNSASITTLSSNKVDKVTGKGLSTNDFTTAYKNLVDSLNTTVASLSADKADKTATVSTVTYNSANAKITKTINGTTSDVVTVATLKSAMELTGVTNQNVIPLNSTMAATHTLTSSEYNYLVDTVIQLGNAAFLNYTELT